MSPPPRPTPSDYGEVAIRNALKTRLIGHDLIFMSATTSTNVAAKKLGRKGCVEGLVVVADHQTAGRGRSKRRWSSPPGSDILVSIVLRPQIGLEQSAKLTGMAGLAVAKSIEELFGLSPEVKWPNDVLLDERKVCGILTEGEPRGHELAFAVVGIGINCNRDEKSFRGPLSQSATSLSVATGGTVDRAKLLARVLGLFEEEYMQFQSSGFASFVPELRKRLFHVERNMTVRTGQEEVTGRCTGIDDEGRLLVTTPDGGRHAFCAGEILQVR